MKLYGDAHLFWEDVDEVRARLNRLNQDGSFAGFITLFDSLLEELPPSFIEPQLVSPSADDENATLVVMPGLQLKAIAAALRAFDFIEPHSFADAPAATRA